MNANERVRRKLWELTTMMEQLQELYGFVPRELPETFGDFYESCLTEIEYYDEDISYERNTEDA